MMSSLNLDEWTGNRTACLLTFRLLHAKLRALAASRAARIEQPQAFDP